VHYFKIILFFILIFFIFPLNLYSEEISLNETEKALNKIFNKYDMASMAITVVNSENTIFKKSFGKRNIENNLINSDNTYFRIASLSKIFTAIGLLSLADKNNVNLDNNIKEYLNFDFYNPHFKNNSITLTHILTHSAGLTEWRGGYGHFLQNMTKDNLKLRDFFDPAKNYYNINIWDKSPPGSKFNYSNLGFGIISAVIENISRETFDNYIKNRIFNPLGIEASFNINDLLEKDVGTCYSNLGNFHIPSLDNIPHIKAVKVIPDNYSPGDNPLFFSPQGGLRINLNEMEIFLKAVLNRSDLLLSKDMWNELEKSKFIPLNFVEKKEYGLGIEFRNDVISDVKMVGHSGESFGITTNLYYNREKNFGFYIMTSGAFLIKSGNSEFYNHEIELFELIKNIIPLTD